ncbi:MAG: SCO family protein [Propionibacteriaceae bacterium]|nr:SCO family protein [Propionibacteriaceae bacterium]
MLTRRCLLASPAAGVLAGCAASEPGAARVSLASDGFEGTAVKGAFALPDVTLSDTSGQPYHLRTSPATPVVVVFFGYSNCPDVCSGILADLATARRRLHDPELAAKITLVCVTTDPARDTPEVLGAYLKRIDPSYVGLTGPLETIVKAANEVGVAIEEGKKLPSGGYEVDHGTQVIGFGPDRKAAVVWTTGTTIAAYKADFAKLASG